MNKIFNALLIVFLGLTAFLRADDEGNSLPLQKIAYPSRIYNPKTVQTVEGSILKINHVKRPGQRDFGIHLILKTSKEELAVHLGPKWFLEEQGASFSVGDEIKVTGSRIQIDHKPAIIASSISKDGKKIELRDSFGIPMWSAKKGYWKQN